MWDLCVCVCVCVCVLAADVHSGDAEPGICAALVLCSWSEALHQWRSQATAEDAAAPQRTLRHL